MASLNVQQMPGTRGFLECWEARPGHVWVEADFTAVEPHALAQLSGDKALWAVYGPDAKPNDIYLFTGWHIPGIGDAIKEIYDAYNPTAEAVAECKRVCKAARKILKVIYLGWSYGAGPKKLHQTLTLGGTEITQDEVYHVWSGLNELYVGVKAYETRLQRQWSRNGGYVLNGLGRPMAIAEDKLKDALNRVIQSTGHDILDILLFELRELVAERQIEAYPIICDLHDQWIFECPTDQSEALLEVYKEALARVNDQLGWEIKIKAEPQIATNLAAIKVED